jgi:hypothetical protein
LGAIFCEGEERADPRTSVSEAPYSIEDQFVPEEMSFFLIDFITGNAATGGAAFRLGRPSIVTSFHIGIPLGDARGRRKPIHAMGVTREEQLLSRSPPKAPRALGFAASSAARKPLLT